jgi:hypothetical protein
VFVAEFFLQYLARDIVVDLLNVGTERVMSREVGYLADDVTYFVLGVFIPFLIAHLLHLALIEASLHGLGVVG